MLHSFCLDHSFLLTSDSAWWGQSFVTELKRISEAGERKVRYGSISGSRPTTGAGLEPSDTSIGAPSNGPSSKEPEGLAAKTKESDAKGAVDAQSHDPEEMEVPLQPKKSATQ